MSDKLQALLGCPKRSNYYCRFPAKMLSVQTQQRIQAATAVWFDHTMLETSGERATLSCTARCIRSATMILAK